MIAVRQSSIKLWRKCRQAYYYKEVEGIEKKITPIALKRGTILHECIEAYYKGKDWRQVIFEFKKEYDKLMEEEKEYYGDLPQECHRIMTGYVQLYGKRKEKPLAVELKFTDVLISGILFEGKIDLILEDEKGTWLTEHKSHKKLPSESDRLLDLQTVIYVLVAEKLGYKIDGVLWNYLRTKPPTVPEVLASGKGISKNKRIDTDYDTYLKAILDNGFDPADYAEQLERARNNPFYLRRYMPKSKRVIEGLFRELKITVLEMEKLKMFPYRNINKMVCRGCQYRSLCEAELLGLDASLIRKSEYKKVEKVEKGGEVIGEEEEDDDI